MQVPVFAGKSNFSVGLRVMSKTPEGSCLRHSAAVLTTLATVTLFNRCPESEKRTTVTSLPLSFGSLASAAAACRTWALSTAKTPSRLWPPPPRRSGRYGADVCGTFAVKIGIEHDLFLLSGIEIGELLAKMLDLGSIVVQDVEARLGCSAA